MNVPQELRSARQAAGLSQRALAAAAGISDRTIAAVEAGRPASMAVVSTLLAACGRRLAVLPVRPPPSVDGHALRSYLRLSLRDRFVAAVERAYGAKARAVLADLEQATYGRHLRLLPPWSLAVWLPDVPVERPLVLRREPGGVAADPSGDWLTLPPLPTPPGRQSPGSSRSDCTPVGIALSRWVGLLVPPPTALAEDTCLAAWASDLHAAARLLHSAAPRDGANRRAPPHRQPDEAGEAMRLAQSLRYLGQPRPDPRDSRAWRLDAPVSLPQWLEQQGMPPLRGQ